MPTPSWKDHRKHVRAIVSTALHAADPAAALRAHWKAPPPLRGRRFILGVGKASVAMVDEAAKLLRGRYRGGMLTLVPGVRSVPGAARVLQLVCDHPLPTPRNVTASRVISGAFTELGPRDELIVLLSGGASAHLTLPAPGLDVEQIAEATRLLQRAGATITELNAVRKHCEQLKGGRLAARLKCRVRTYVLSDVIGDALDVIGSGPTAPDPTTYEQALQVLKRYRLLKAAPAIVTHLRRGVAGKIEETPKPGDPRLARVKHTIVASNTRVVAAVAAHLRTAGFRVSARPGVTGEAARVSRDFVRGALAATGKGARAWVLGGETTVTVGRSAGEGGPSQEFALAGAIALRGRPGWVLVTFSTDGRDGPTEAAGGVVTGESFRKMDQRGVSPRDALRRHDSGPALRRIGGLLAVKPTGTNLNHVAVLIRYPGGSTGRGE